MGFSNEYVIAWTLYVVAGVGCCLVWWKVTALIGNRGWRDILRGLAVVIIFTPWYAGETPEFYAPAALVLLMDVLLEGTASGLKGGVVLLVATFAMLVVIVVKEFWWRRRQRSRTPEPSMDASPGATPQDG